MASKPTHYADSQNSDVTAQSGRELYHLYLCLQSGNVWIHPRIYIKRFASSGFILIRVSYCLLQIFLL